MAWLVVLSGVVVLGGDRSGNEGGKVRYVHT